MTDHELLLSEPKTCKLKSVETATYHGHCNLIITLSAKDPQALVEAERKLIAQPRKDTLGPMLVERENLNTLKITAAAEPDTLDVPLEEKSAIVAEAIHDITGCRLGHMNLVTEALQIPGKHPQYAAAVNIEPLVDQRNPSNLVGHYSVAIIRRKLEKAMFDGYGENPANLRLDQLQLMKLDAQYSSPAEAIFYARKTIEKLTQTYGIYKPKPPELMLVGLHDNGETFLNDSGIAASLDTDKRSQSPSHAATATLTGDEKALHKASIALKGAYFLSQTSSRVNGNTLEFTVQGDGFADSARFVEKLRRLTRCELPLNIVAGTVPTQNGFRPCLFTELSNSVPTEDRRSTAKAFTGYIALAMPFKEDALLAELPPNGPPRIVVSQTFDTQQKALACAQNLRADAIDHIKKRDHYLPGQR